MRTNHLRTLSIPVLAASLWLAGCAESGERLTGPGEITHGKTPTTTATTTESGTLYTYPTRSTPLLEDRWGSSVLGRDGGEVVVGPHRLYVPAGTVRRLTMFTVTVRKGSKLVVDVTAHERDRNGLWTVDVGANGFSAPLALGLNYKEVEPFVSDGSKLKTLRLLDGTFEGKVEKQWTVVDTSSKIVHAALSHGGRFALGSPK